MTADRVRWKKGAPELPGLYWVHWAIDESVVAAYVTPSSTGLRVCVQGLSYRAATLVLHHAPLVPPEAPGG